MCFVQITIAFADSMSMYYMHDLVRQTIPNPLICDVDRIVYILMELNGNMKSYGVHKSEPHDQLARVLP